MSIDLTIIPHDLVSWENICEQWRNFFRSEKAHILQNPQLLDLPNKDRIQASNPMFDESQYFPSTHYQKNYLLELGEKNGFILSVIGAEYFDDSAMIADFTNEPKLIKKLIQMLSDAKHYYELYSYPGNRNENEYQLMICLASAIAKSSNGYILFNEIYSFSGLDIGVYSPEEFIQMAKENTL